jgi:hypothetical protein
MSAPGIIILVLLILSYALSTPEAPDVDMIEDASLDSTIFCDTCPPG